MKKIILIFLFLYSNTIFSADLELQFNFKLITKVSEQEFKNGTLHFNKNGIHSVDKTLYNPWRKYNKNYKGYLFFELLDLYFTNEWRSAREIAFVSLDGYVQKEKIANLLKESAKDKIGYLAYSEVGQTGFSKFYKDKKLIDPAPFYLVWSNFTSNDQVKHSDPLKWPFQLKAIIITN